MFICEGFYLNNIYNSLLGLVTCLYDIHPFFWQVVTVKKAALTTEILGVAEAPVDGFVEVLLKDQDPLLMEQKMWEPFEEALQKGKLFVNVEIVGKRVSNMTAAEPRTEE